VEYSAWALLYLLVRGRVRIAGGRSGRTMQRNTRLERGVHWFTAALFIILGLSGLTLTVRQMGPDPAPGS